MKILFDASTPAPLMRYLHGHKVTRARQLGWHMLVNGKLLDAAEKAGFDALITCDQSIPYQQNFASRRIAVVALTTNHWPTLQKVAPRVATAVDFVQRGTVITIDVALM